MRSEVRWNAGRADAALRQRCANSSTFPERSDPGDLEALPLHVPPNPPAKTFGSLTIDDAYDRVQIDNPSQVANISSR